jgi:hypothetical protein
MRLADELRRRDPTLTLEQSILMAGARIELARRGREPSAEVQRARALSEKADKHVREGMSREDAIVLADRELRRVQTVRLSRR